MSNCCPLGYMFLGISHQKARNLFPRLYEPVNDKTNIIICAPSEDSDQLGHLPSLISLRCMHEETLGPWLSIECINTD